MHVKGWRAVATSRGRASSPPPSRFAATARCGAPRSLAAAPSADDAVDQQPARGGRSRRGVAAVHEVDGQRDDRRRRPIAARRSRPSSRSRCPACAAAPTSAPPSRRPAAAAPWPRRGGAAAGRILRRGRARRGMTRGAGAGVCAGAGAGDDVAGAEAYASPSGAVSSAVAVLGNSTASDIVMFLSHTPLAHGPHERFFSRLRFGIEEGEHGPRPAPPPPRHRQAPISASGRAGVCRPASSSATPTRRAAPRAAGAAGTRAALCAAARRASARRGSSGPPASAATVACGACARTLPDGADRGGGEGRPGRQHDGGVRARRRALHQRTRARRPPTTPTSRAPTPSPSTAARRACSGAACGDATRCIRGATTSARRAPRAQIVRQGRRGVLRVPQDREQPGDRRLLGAP